MAGFLKKKYDFLIINFLYGRLNRFCHLVLQRLLTSILPGITQRVTRDDWQNEDGWVFPENFAHYIYKRQKYVRFDNKSLEVKSLAAYP